MKYEEQIADIRKLIEESPEVYVRSLAPETRTVLFQTCQIAQREGLMDDLDPNVRQVYLNKPEAFETYQASRDVSR